MSILQSTYRSAQNIFFSPNQLVRGLALGSLLAAGAALIALFIGIAGPLLALVAAAAMIAAVLILADTHWGFVALCGVVFLLPFASLPFSVGFKPTFLDLALGALFFVWFFKLVIGQEREFVASPLGILVALFLLIAVFSFALGLDAQPGQHVFCCVASSRSCSASASSSSRSTPYAMRPRSTGSRAGSCWAAGAVR